MTNSNNEPPTSSVCFSMEDIRGSADDESDITGPCYGDDDECDADAYYFHAIDDDERYDYDEGNNGRNDRGGGGLRSSMVALDGSGHNRHRRSLRRSGVRRDQSRHQENRHSQDLLALKLQIARQQETIDILSCRLGQAEDEREALQAEKCVLVDELAAAIKEQPDTRRRWFPKGERAFKNLSELDMSGRASSHGGGSMQMLVDANSRLMTENARLQVTVDVMRKSFQTYIKDGRRTSEEDTETIRTLMRENEYLRRSVGSKKLASSERTAKTLESSFASGGSQGENEALAYCVPIGSEANSNSNHNVRSSQTSEDSIPLGASLHSIPERGANNLTESNLDSEFGQSGDDWLMEGDELFDDSSEDKKDSEEKMRSEDDANKADEDKVEENKVPERRLGRRRSSRRCSMTSMRSSASSFKISMEYEIKDKPDEPSASCDPSRRGPRPDNVETIGSDEIDAMLGRDEVDVLRNSFKATRRFSLPMPSLEDEEEMESSRREGEMVRSKSQDLLVDFGERRPRRQPRRTINRLAQSLDESRNGGRGMARSSSRSSLTQSLTAGLQESKSFVMSILPPHPPPQEEFNTSPYPSNLAPAARSPVRRARRASLDERQGGMAWNRGSINVPPRPPRRRTEDELLVDFGERANYDNDVLGWGRRPRSDARRWSSLKW